jgi:hypothetical protein
VLRTTSSSRIGAESWPAGTFLVRQDAGTRTVVPDLARALGLNVVATDAPLPARHVQLSMPRIGLYGAWGGNTDEGWTRWLLDQFEFPYTTLRDQAIRRSDLRRHFDVIVLPDATYREMTSGVPDGDLPDEYTGGMTGNGVEHLRTFVMEGGVLIAQDRATELPVVAFGLPVTDTTAVLGKSQFNTPGTLVRLLVDPDEPLAWGLPREIAAFVAQSPSFSVGNRASARSVAVYPERDVLLSGWLQGESFLRNRTAVVDVPFGRGRVSLLGFRVQHRGQSHGTFKLLFNAIHRK